MPKYKSFTEYLQDNYYGQIKESLLAFVNENGLRSDDGIMMKLSNYEIVSLNVTGLILRSRNSAMLSLTSS